MKFGRMQEKVREKEKDVFFVDNGSYVESFTAHFMILVKKKEILSTINK